MKTLTLTAALAALMALTGPVLARGIDDANGRDCSPCVPGEPTASRQTPDDVDLWDGRDPVATPAQPAPNLDDGR